MKWVGLIIVLTLAEQAGAQSWMTGYAYRKKITIDKSKVLPVTVTENGKLVVKDLSDFQVLIEIQDADLVHVPGSCANKVADAAGRDISFALASSPSLSLNFQLEHYEPSSGKLSCWVRLASLSANGTSTAATSVYLYYGGLILNGPLSTQSVTTWTSDFLRVWHMDGVSSGNVPDALGVTGRALLTNGAAGAVQAVNGKAGTGVGFSGTNGCLASAEAVSSAFTISIWLKPVSAGPDQVIFANDSLSGNIRNGCVVRLTADGKPVLEMYRSMSVSIITGNTALQVNKWHYLVITVSAAVANIRLDDKIIGSKSSNVLGTGGSLRIGQAKQGGMSFSGVLDELRIQSTSREAEWYNTQRVNQNDPGGFISVGEEEYDPAQFATFTGASGNSWNLAANWKNSAMPSASGNVVIGAGKSAVISGGTGLTFGRLIVREGASLTSAAGIKVGCTLCLNAGAAMQLTGVLTCLGDVVNDGSIKSGGLLISGKSVRQELRGRGHAYTDKLEIDKAALADTVVLKTPLDVAAWLDLRSGVLDAGGFLTLTDTPGKSTARILPMLNRETATITGDVNVQYWVTGIYPAPGSARGWRLLSSPVFQNTGPEPPAYTLSAHQQAMFITGPGGTAKGFDPSPLNNNTIYTHDPQRAGTLNQKYIPIADMTATIPLGRGIFVFSRGPRDATNAYLEQVQGPVFSNPAGYRIRYTGKVFTGELLVNLSNINHGTPGDGFNLVGNPYPAPVIWGALEKENLGPYIWLYDPMNKDYKVTDLPDTEIPSGTGFFVRVVSGKTFGTVRFNELAKKSATVTASLSFSRPQSALASAKNITRAAPAQEIIASLSYGNYTDTYRVSFTEDGNDCIDELDAPKINEGLVSIAVQRNDTLMAIEKRARLVLPARLELHTILPGEGSCRLGLQLSEPLLRLADIQLNDRYTNDLIKVNETSFAYTFFNTKAAEVAAGKGRFVLELTAKKDSLTQTRPHTNIKPGRSYQIYPNPVSSDLFVEVPGEQNTTMDLEITDLSGRTITVYRALPVNKGGTMISCYELETGTYLLKLSLPGSKPVIVKLVKL